LILPVHNAQLNLAADVARILEILPELTRNFEIVIVDDGSTDHTWEVAEDLATKYPQIKIAAAPGAAGAIHSGIQLTRGELVLAHDGQTAINPAQLARIWNNQRATATSLGTARDPLMRHTLVRQSANVTITMPTLTGAEGGFHLLDPNMIQRLRRSVAAVNNMQWRGERQPKAVQPISSATHTITHQKSDDKSAEIKRPNYLSQLKERLQKLAWGE